jgi:hypothetical protein
LVTSAAYAAAPSASGQIDHGARIGDSHVQRARQFKGGGQCPRAAELNLQQSAVPLEDLFHDVQVGGEHGPGPGHVAAGPLGQPPAARGDLGRDVDEQASRPADHVGTRPAAGQLGQVREIGQLTGDDAHGLIRVRPWHRADPGRGAGLPGITLLVLVLAHAPELRTAR